MEPSERERIRQGIPRGSLNSIAVQLLTEYAQQQARHRQAFPMGEDTAA